MTKARARWENEKWWEQAWCNSLRGLEREDEKKSCEQQNHSDAHHKAHSYRRRKIICRPPRVMNHPGIVQPLDFCLRRQAIYRDTPYWRKIFTFRRSGPRSCKRSRTKDSSAHAYTHTHKTSTPPLLSFSFENYITRASFHHRRSGRWRHASWRAKITERTLNEHYD